MNTARHWMLTLALFATLAFAPAAHSAEFKGSWTIAKSDEAGMVQFGLTHRMHGGNSQSQMDWPVSVFQGLDLQAAGKRDVQFTITRDAGRFDCEGYLNGGEGAGLFRFTPNARFVSGMAALGFDDIDEHMQFAMAVHDVSVEFAKAMKAEKLGDFDTDKLIAFRIFDVNPAFIRAMRAAGLAATDSDRLIAFRVHDVSPEFVARIERLGYKRPDPDQLVAMRVHDVTPEFITSLKSRGLKDLSIDQLINLRVHGIE